MRGERKGNPSPREAEPSVRAATVRAASATKEPQAAPAKAPAVTPPPADDRRPGLTPLSLLVVLAVGYLLLQIQFVLVLLLLALVFATVIQKPVDQLERWRLPRPLAILLV